MYMFSYPFLLCSLHETYKVIYHIIRLKSYPLRVYLRVTSSSKCPPFLSHHHRQWMEDGMGSIRSQAPYFTLWDISFIGFMQILISFKLRPQLWAMACTRTQLLSGSKCRCPPITWDPSLQSNTSYTSYPRGTLHDTVDRDSQCSLSETDFMQWSHHQVCYHRWIMSSQTWTITHQKSHIVF